MYIAVGGQIGTFYTGRSVIVDPLVAMLAGPGDEVTVATADVSHERLAAVRARLPVLAQRRAALSADAPPALVAHAAPTRT
jgi:predicted amidohydrolase